MRSLPHIFQSTLATFTVMFIHLKISSHNIIWLNVHFIVRIRCDSPQSRTPPNREFENYPNSTSTSTLNSPSELRTNKSSVSTCLYVIWYHHFNNFYITFQLVFEYWIIRYCWLSLVHYKFLLLELFYSSILFFK